MIAERLQDNDKIIAEKKFKDPEKPEKPEKHDFKARIKIIVSYIHTDLVKYLRQNGI